MTLSVRLRRWWPLQHLQSRCQRHLRSDTLPPKPDKPFIGEAVGVPGEK